MCSFMFVPDVNKRHETILYDANCLVFFSATKVFYH